VTEPPTDDDASGSPTILTAESLAQLAGDIPLPDDWARAANRERLDQLAKPVGALGRLEELSTWLAGVQSASPPHPLRRPRLVIFAGDHGVAAHGVSAYPASVTPLMVRAFRDGTAAANALARQSGAGVRVVDISVDVAPDVDADDPALTRYKVRRGSGRIDVEDAMTLEETSAALRAGMAIADEEVDAGADLLIAGDMGIGNTTPAAALVGVLTGSDAASVIGRGTGIGDRGWMRKCAAIRDAMRRGRPVQADIVELLSRIAGPDFAATTGFLLQAAARRTPVLLDGVVSCACALVAHSAAPRASLWWLAGHRSPEPSAALALQWLALEPVVDLGMRLGEGTGALVALPVLQAAAVTSAEMALLSDVLGEPSGPPAEKSSSPTRFAVPATSEEPPPTPQPPAVPQPSGGSSQAPAMPAATPTKPLAPAETPQSPPPAPQPHPAAGVREL